MLKFSSSTQGIEISGRMSPARLMRFKAVIPRHCRNFDWQKKTWFVDTSQINALQRLFPMEEIKALHLYPPRIVTKVLRIYYIGSTKPDFNNMARGTMNPRGNGEWLAIFPKNVLENWFNFGFAPKSTEKEADLSGDFYEVLGLQRGDDQAKIKRGYRKLARQFHPDNQKTGEEQKFLVVKDAYDVLSDPSKRKIYDAGLALEEMGSRKSKKTQGIYPNYIPPQRCGDILVEAEEKLGLFFVKKIMAWNQITQNGKILETKWDAKNSRLKKEWV